VRSTQQRPSSPPVTAPLRRTEMHHAHIVHHTPGRIRLKMHAGKRNSELLHKIRHAIKSRPGVRDVSVNSTTGSVVVHYDSSQWKNSDSEIHAAANDSGLFTIAPPESEQVEAIEREAEFLAEHSDLARLVVNYVEQFNQNVKRATNNTLDLNVLVPLGAAFYAFLEIESDVATPLWLTLGIFSFNSFVSLHSQKARAAAGVNSSRVFV